ncbi:MAG: acetate/propionate family kinase [Clostridiales bacterium]|nr:acetate/propionate family kinase [Clostridiales bacterium]
MMRILVLNLGSTSFKCKLYQMSPVEVQLASGGVESIGGHGRYVVQAGEKRREGECACKTHLDALELFLEALGDLGMSMDREALDAVGYKAVHGGSLSGAHLVDDALMEQMDKMAVFAPAHNPVYLSMMRSVRERYDRIRQIACFETAFHATMPLERAVYGVPYAWAMEDGLRRYGFHGSSHSYIAWKMGQIAPHARRVISAHLGGSSSLCAILDGQSVYNTMGATPQSGLFHNNRVGDLDVFCLPALIQRLGGLEEAMKALSTQSGLLGLSGVSNDLREVEQAAEEGNDQAALAVKALVDEVVGYTGMLTAYLGGLDALVFTGGIGFNGAKFRRKVVGKLGFCGARIDDTLNYQGYEGLINAADSDIEIWALQTNEELMVARACVRLLKGC